MRKGLKDLAVLLGVVAFFGCVIYAFADFRGDLVREGVFASYTDGGLMLTPDFRVIGAAAYQADPGGTEAEITFTKARVGDCVLATVNTANTTYKSLQAVAGAGTVTLYFEADPQAEVRVTLLVFRHYTAETPATSSTADVPFR